MKRFAALLAGAIALSGCAGVSPPGQPTPVSVQASIASISAITADPVSAWKAGGYSVHAACDLYLNSLASRSSDFSAASAAIGTGGAAASVIWPPAGGLAALTQAFLSEFQSAGAIPYSAQTSAMVENALGAYEAAVALAPPADLYDAMNDVEGLWNVCTLSGVAQLAVQAIGTAQVTAGAPGAPAAAAFSSRIVPLASGGRPKVYVNGH